MLVSSIGNAHCNRNNKRKRKRQREHCAYAVCRRLRLMLPSRITTTFVVYYDRYETSVYYDRYITYGTTKQNKTFYRCVTKFFLYEVTYGLQYTPLKCSHTLIFTT